jgi:leader peptidase (prepilin peptidase)/N-methyltransferase
LIDPWQEVLFWRTAALLFGLIVGSFANVCIHRIPREQSVVAPRSRCPHCGHALSAWENVPVLSYLVLLGRCRECRKPIAPRYPLVELANGVAYLGLALLHPPSARAFVSMALVTALLVLSLIDLEHYILPDAITKPGIALGLLASFLPGWPVPPLEALLSAAGGYLAFLAIAKLYQSTRGLEGLGQGDWKMAAMLGAFLGWQALLLTVLLASVAGTLAGLVMILRGAREGLQAKVPLGTFLGLAGVGVVFAGAPLLRWYLSLYRV